MTNVSSTNQSYADSEDSIFNVSTIWPSVSFDNVTEEMNTSVVSDTYVSLLEDVSRYLWVIFSPILFIVGVTGNVLTIGVLRQMKFHKKPPFFFLFVLALSDITVLCVGLSRYWIRETFSSDIRALTNFGCKFNLFFIYWSMQLSSWILVCVVLERCIKTNFPYRYPRIVTIPRCIALVFLLMVVLAGVDMHYFWTNGLIPDGSEWECNSLTDAYFNFEEFVFTYVDFTVLSVLPFLLMIAMNATIIRVIRQSRKFRKCTVRSKSTNKKLKKFDLKLTRMLVYTSVYFLVATLPISVYFIVDSYQEDITDLQSAKMDVVWSSSYLFQFSNYTINFFLYNLINKKFRNKFIDLIKCRSPTKKRKSSKSDSVYSVQTADTFIGSETTKDSEEMSTGE
ncbi:adenosine receptor A3-like [Saccostrea echinata]|uniref:adenosine receptor A3-like n=1 Tax=Saccostrea echinata TaxID=191078 RepID=UPI002A81CC5E|nr:adenosine receptor A3-like [Saccostrea echinata]